MVNAFLCALLWRLGGNGYIRLRRWGIPLVILLLHQNWTGLISALALFTVTSLPITLTGDDVKENLDWIVVLGLLHGLTLFPITSNILLSIAVGFTYWGLVYLTTKEPYKWDWKYFEIIFGFLFGLCI